MKLWPRTWKRWLALSLAALVVLLMFHQFELSQVYYPDRHLVCTGAELGRPFEDVSFRSQDRTRLHGWFFPAHTNSARAHIAVVLCHGNAGNISHRLETCSALLETGVSVFAFDYRGYGKSEGRPSEEGTYLDAEAAFDWVKNKSAAGTIIIAYGESLGGGVASELAVRRPCGGLILQSTFTSIPDLGAELFPWLPVRWLGKIKYDTCSKLPRLRLPVLILHSRADGLIRYRHAETNFAAANQPKILWELKGTHNDPVNDRSGYIEGLEKFMSLLNQKRSDR